LIYYGTANPGPWNANERPGDNLWTTTIFARNPDTGQAKWAYQITPHDLFDHDEINESILLDLPINGQPHKVLVHIARAGYMYVIDRLTGEVLSADPYDTVNATGLSRTRRRSRSWAAMSRMSVPLHPVRKTGSPRLGRHARI
jgi:lanthanide-dependent methanol dehydrogenase